MGQSGYSWALLRLLVSRYFVGLRRKSVVGALTGISVLGVAVSAGAMVVVLSAFNGLEGLIRDLYKSWDAGLLVTPVSGKFFRADSTLITRLSALEGVSHVYQVAEDNALLRFGDGQAVIRLKGVEPAYAKRPGMKQAMAAGRFELGTPGAWGIIMGAGVEYNLQVPIHGGFSGAQIWYPRVGKSIGLDPRSAFTRQAVIATGVFQVEKQYDERFVFADRRLVADLMEQPDASTALEIDLKADIKPATLTKNVQALVGPAFDVKTSEQQHESLMRVLLLERLFVFLALAVILLISSFNIFTALSMLAVEKRRDMAVLGAMGAPGSLVRALFLGVGLAISTVGAASGLGLGLLVCWVQDRYKLVSMGLQAAIIQEYPVKVLWPDLWLIAGTVVLVSLAVSWIPAQGAVVGAQAGVRGSM